TIYLLYTSFAARDLDRHASRVHAALKDGHLEEARRRLSLIVGRDTAALQEREIVRAAVESVGESTLDGVIAPLFYAALGGAPAARKGPSWATSTAGSKPPTSAAPSPGCTGRRSSRSRSSSASGPPFSGICFPRCRRAGPHERRRPRRRSGPGRPVAALARRAV